MKSLSLFLRNLQEGGDYVGCDGRAPEAWDIQQCLEVHGIFKNSVFPHSRVWVDVMVYLYEERNGIHNPPNNSRFCRVEAQRYTPPRDVELPPYQAY